MDNRADIPSDIIHRLSKPLKPVSDVAVVSAKAQGVGIGVAEDGRNIHPIVFDGSIRINTILLTEIGRQLTGLGICSVEVVLISQVILANLELNPSVITGTLTP